MLTKEIKKQVFNEIINTPNFLGNYEEYDGILTFLSKIWNLKDLPSEDSRFKNAYDDTYQHVINNDDWTTDYIFLERFKLIEGEENNFILFLEVTVNPTVRKSKDEILMYVSKINSIIQQSGFRLILTSYFEELPVYKYRAITDFDDLPIEIQANNIPIYLEKSNINYTYPCFVLEYVRWDDYGNKTTFDLFYFSSSSKRTNIGQVKIMRKDTSSTLETLHPFFTNLSNEYCSLGQTKKYYLNLKEVLGTEYTSFLLALRDSAIFPRIHELFENDSIYIKSLIRGNEMERLSRTIRFEIENISSNEYFKFNYSHKLPYAENIVTLNFDFEYNTDFEHRIYAIIGKNGTGKTRILSALAKELSEKAPQSFSPKKPVYGKVFTVSYSFFDKFEIPNSDASFNYVYCGLKKNDKTWKSEEDLKINFYNAVELIKQKKLETEWYNILKNFIVSDILDKTFDMPDEDEFVFNESKFNRIEKYLSSGQSIVLFMISEILSQIRYDSLILFDEPETHLHPNAISALLNTLFELVKKFQSFCVLATHSPLIIQEIPARNIFVLEREKNRAFIRQLERESFGENLTVITQEIFGNREEPKHFVSLISKLVKKGKSYEEILSILETDNLPVSSNIRLYIKALISESK